MKYFLLHTCDTFHFPFISILFAIQVTKQGLGTCFSNLNNNCTYLYKNEKKNIRCFIPNVSLIYQLIKLLTYFYFTFIFRNASLTSEYLQSRFISQNDITRICNAKDTEIKRAGKKERREARKKILNRQSKKLQFFWLMRMHQIEIIQIFFLQEIYLFGTKELFQRSLSFMAAK